MDTIIKKFSLFSLLLLIVLACSHQKKVTTTNFLGETGHVNYYNFDKSDKPIAVVIPSVFESLIHEKVIQNLAKKYRVAVVRLPNDSNILRLQSVDRLTFRTNYYASIISEIEEKYDTISTLISEGDNSNISINIAANFKHPKLILINSWYPSLKEKLVNTCYINPRADCDSLLAYLHFTDRYQVDSLFSNIENQGVDNLYGNYTSDAWKNYLVYNAQNNLETYKNTVYWIYTTNTGLLTQGELNQRKKSFGKLKNVMLLSKKEFYKKYPLSNN